MFFTPWHAPISGPLLFVTFQFFQERVYPDFTLYAFEVDPVYAGTASVGPNKPLSVTEDVFPADLVVERVKAVGRLLLGLGCRASSVAS